VRPLSLVPVGLLALAATGAVVGPARAGERSVEERLAAARSRLVGDLVALADWTLGQGLDAQRERTLVLVLELDPENAAARRALGWKKRRGSGEWVAPPDRPPAVDTRPARLPAREARWRKAFETYGDALASLGGDPFATHPDSWLAAVALLARGLPDDARVVATVERVRAEIADPRVPPETHEALEERLEAVFPDDARVRAARGHVRGEAGWILAETALALRRRRDLEARAAALREESVEAASLEPTAREAECGLEGLACFGDDELRVVGTVDPKVLRRVAQSLTRAPAVFEWAFRTAPAAGPRQVWWHVKDLAQARAVVGRVFGGSDRLLEEMAAYHTLPLGATEVVWSIAGDDPAWRLDSSLFGAQERALARTFGLEGRYESLRTALVRWLVWRQVGTRLSSVLDRSYADPPAGMPVGDLGNPAFDWAAGAAAVLRPHKNRGMLRLALGKRTGSQTKADALVAYAFAAWLVEGHEGDEAARISTRLGREQNDDLGVAFVEVFGRTVDQVERRLERFCREAGTGACAPAAPR
jgi:hypothetical protein